MIKKYITFKDGVVKGIILIDDSKDPIESLDLGQGVAYLEWSADLHEGVGAGDLYDGVNFTSVPNPEPTIIEPTKDELMTQLQELMAKIQSLPN
jgi:hypothetical protein